MSECSSISTTLTLHMDSTVGQLSLERIAYKTTDGTPAFFPCSNETDASNEKKRKHSLFNPFEILFVPRLDVSTQPMSAIQTSNMNEERKDVRIPSATRTLRHTVPVTPAPPIIHLTRCWDTWGYFTFMTVHCGRTTRHFQNSKIFRTLLRKFISGLGIQQSMDSGAAKCVYIYVCTFSVAPSILAWMLEPIAKHLGFSRAESVGRKGDSRHVLHEWMEGRDSAWKEKKNNNNNKKNHTDFAKIDGE